MQVKNILGIFESDRKKKNHKKITSVMLHESSTVALTAKMNLAGRKKKKDGKTKQSEC